MKKKKKNKTYVLLGIVLVVWGMIGFKIIRALSPKAIPTKTAEVSTGLSKETLVKKDTFSILANYRDPFLGTMPSAPKKTVKKTKSTSQPALPEIEVIYTGLLANTKEKIFFISIDGQQHLMKAGEKIQEVKLLGGDKSAVRLQIRGARKTVKVTA